MDTFILITLFFILFDLFLSSQRFKLSKFTIHRHKPFLYGLNHANGYLSFAFFIRVFYLLNLNLVYSFI